MSKLWKPMLAAKPDPEDLDAVLAKLPYPALFSPKLDGIRATVQNGKLYSRSLKLIPNKEMQVRWGKPELNGLDGELVVGPPTAEDCFNRSTSVVMSRDKSAEDAAFYVFDTFGSDPFYMRTDLARDAMDCDSYTGHNGIIYVEHTLIETPKQLSKYEAKQLKLGYEGIMRRSKDCFYKQGRSTLKERGLIAIKRFVDVEAVILATYEQEENTNAQKVSELGKMKRSSHKAGKVGKGTLGGFTVRMLEPKAAFGVQGEEFNVATGVGLTDAIRQTLWNKRKTLPGKIIKMRYQKVGTMEKPRIPIFLGFRDEKDL